MGRQDTILPRCQKLKKGRVCSMQYHNITHDDMLNGSGLRVVLWVSGCNHRCEDCQNPQTWDCKSGIPFDVEAKEELFNELSKDYISGITFSGGDPLHENNLKEILDLVKEIRKKYPKAQDVDLKTQHVVRNPDENHYILNKNTDEIRISFPTKTIWLYTGYTWNQIMYPVVTDDFNPNRDKIIKMRQEIVKQCDVLVDGEYKKELRDVTLHWIGSSNQKVIDVKKTLQSDKIILLE